MRIRISWCRASWATTVGFTFTSSASGSAAEVNVTAAGTGDFLDATNLGVKVTKGTDVVTTDDLGGSYNAAGNHITVTSGVYKGLSFDMTSDANDTITIASNNSLKLQIGANAGQNMSISINDMRATALGVAGWDMTSAAGAKLALEAIDQATETVFFRKSQTRCLPEPVGEYHQQPGNHCREPDLCPVSCDRRGYGCGNGRVLQEQRPVPGCPGHAGPGQPAAPTGTAAPQIKFFTPGTPLYGVPFFMLKRMKITA